MTREELKDFISKLHPSNYRWLKKQNKEIYKLIISNTAFLPEDATMRQRIFCIINDVVSAPVCLVCGKKTKYVYSNNKYAKYCSSKCFSNDEKVKEKRKKTNLEKHGISNGHSEITKSKIKKTCLERYGVEHHTKNHEVRKKYKHTMLEKYGVENAFQSEEIKKKIKQTNLKKYGTENPQQSNDIKNKTKKTLLRRYGVENYNQRHINKDVLQKLDDQEWLYKQHKILKKSLIKIAEELGIRDTTVARYCKKHNIKISIHGVSQNEQEIVDFIRSVSDTEIIRNTRKVISPKELDIYLPEFNLAIEHNGLYWHSEIEEPDSYHLLKKTKMCEEKGIRLLHIMEDEWKYQKEKCKQTIRHLLGKSDFGIYARNTTIREISWNQAKQFLETYHLLGSGSSGTYRIGAFDEDDKLIAVMVFGTLNHEHSDSNKVELKRFVTNKNNNPGIGSKLFKFALREKDYSEVFAYVDRRWFTGLVKEHIGFEVIGTTKPSVWYTDFKKRYHRRFLTKKKMMEQYGFDEKMSKREMIYELGFVRIWDCGKLILKYSN